MTSSLLGRSRGLLLLAAVLPATACLTARTPDLRQDVEALRSQVAQVQKQSIALDGQLSALRQGGGSSTPATTELAALDSRIASLDAQVAALRQKLDDMLEQVNSLSQDLRSTRELALRAQPPRTAPSQPPEGDGEGSTPSPEGAAADDEPKPSSGGIEDTYNAAYADFSKGSYSLAIAGFQDFLKRYPQSELADNAQYWIGESHFSQGDFESAAAQYEVVIEKYPKGDKVPAALLKRGLCFLEMNRTPEGVVLLQHLIEAYPQSEEAALARDRLQGLGLKP